MDFTNGEIFHVYNRGNQQQKIFYNHDNYLFFLKKIRKELLVYCDLLAYCLMPNHFHWLLKIKDSHPMTGSHRMTNSIHPLSKAIATLLRSYTRAIQKQENFTGSLFQQKTKAKAIADEDMTLLCCNYIHQNPMKAGLVERMEDWEYSSFRDYCGKRQGTLCIKELLLDLAGIKADEDFNQLSYSTLRDFDVQAIL